MLVEVFVFHCDGRVLYVLRNGIQLDQCALGFAVNFVQELAVAVIDFGRLWYGALQEGVWVRERKAKVDEHERYQGNANCKSPECPSEEEALVVSGPLPSFASVLYRTLRNVFK